MLPLTFARFVCQTLVGYLPSPILPVWFEGGQNAAEEFTSLSSWPIRVQVKPFWKAKNTLYHLLERTRKTRDAIRCAMNRCAILYRTAEAEDCSRHLRPPWRPWRHHIYRTRLPLRKTLGAHSAEKKLHNFVLNKQSTKLAITSAGAF